MSEPTPAAPASPQVTIVPVPMPQQPSALRSLFRLFFTLFLLGSVFLNLVLLAQGCSGGSLLPLDEKFHSGKRLATNKIALVDIEGALMEGMNAFARKQIEQAAEDENVKAVVLRINSPGGSITASDDLHRRLTELRDGNGAKGRLAKPLLVSMASLAASGGYYIAMPAKTIFAERTSITGSIGVYAAFPNVKELSDKIGFRMNVVKAGKIKDSGSPFQEMGEEERKVWEGMVDHAYLQFIQVVEQGRPQLKGKMQEELQINETLPVRNREGATKTLQLTRYRADGGIFTAQEALTYGLIDRVGYLDEAILAARDAAGLGEDYKAVSYSRPVTLVGALTGDSSGSDLRFDPGRWSNALTPRLWYLAPGAELSGVLQAMGRQGTP